MQRLPLLLRLLRPHQWIKNGFVLMGMVFSHRWDEPDLVIQVLTLTAAFCAVSSGVYVLNDVMDRHADRAHAQKRHRPVASGEVSVRVALTTGFALVAAGSGLAWTVSTAAGLLVLSYVLLNIAYSSGLKHIAILDVFLIASGFMLRVLTGTLGVGIEPSRWLLGCTLMLTLFLGFAKRRAELSALNGVPRAGDVPQRRSLEGYSAALLDRLITISAAGSVLGYALYVLDARTVMTHGTDRLIWTLPPVLYGLFRYMYVLYREGAGADPAREVLADPHLLASVLIWIGLTTWLLAGA